MQEAREYDAVFCLYVLHVCVIESNRQLRNCCVRVRELALVTNIHDARIPESKEYQMYMACRRRMRKFRKRMIDVYCTI